MIGLMLDILGVIGLFLWGLPSEVSKNGLSAIGVEGKDTLEKKKKYCRHKWMSRISLSLLILGFMLQVFANYLTWRLAWT